MYRKRRKESMIDAGEASSLLLFKWFNNNFMKDNNDKKHLRLRFSEPFIVVIDGSSIKSNVKRYFLE